MSAKRRFELPRDLEQLREHARQTIAPIVPAPVPAGRTVDDCSNAGRTNAGRDLPPYYLVYFLLVDLLSFPDLGVGEKVAWVVPIDFNGTTFTVEYQKFGVGVFVPDSVRHEEAARRIVGLIKRGVAVAEPFFEWLAATAVAQSKLNIPNSCGWLFERYEYLRAEFNKVRTEAESRKDEQHVTIEKRKREGTVKTIVMPARRLRANARWLGLATIEAFFSWTEHLFIHLAILQGHVTTGEAVAELAEADWHTKFKSAFDLSDPSTKASFDRLVTVRRDLRNFVAHGVFGKDGGTFQFHSTAGAVPVLLTRRAGRKRVSLAGQVEFAEKAALDVIDQFIPQIWSGARAPARAYLERSGLPTILTMASDGTYAHAMSSAEAMDEFVEDLTDSFDEAADMDF